MSTSRARVLPTLQGESVVICPSLLNCDLGRLCDEIDSARSSGAEVVHWDVMDAHFVPNFTYGPPVIEACRKSFPDMVFDVHLMMSDPAKYLDEFVRAGSDSITFHLEAVPDPRELIARVKAAGVAVGLAVNPATSIAMMEPFLDIIDLSLVMTVVPGFGGQAFDAAGLPKVRRVRQLAGERIVVQVDGGVNRRTIADAKAAGANWFVVGSAFFQAADRPAEFGALRQLAHAAAPRVASDRG